MTRADLLLVQLSEECAEVVQATQKALRFGLTEVYPVTNESNVDRIVREIHDVAAVIEKLIHEGVFSKTLMKPELVRAKMEKIETMMIHSIKCGRLE